MELGPGTENDDPVTRASQEPRQLLVCSLSFSSAPLYCPTQVVLRNRHHEAIEIHAELIRVPKHIVPLYGIVASPSSRESISASHSTLRYSTSSSPRGSLVSRQRSGASLPAAMSALLVSQWTDFVEKELEERRTLEEAVQGAAAAVQGTRAQLMPCLITLLPNTPHIGLSSCCRYAHTGPGHPCERLC